MNDVLFISAYLIKYQNHIIVVTFSKSYGELMIEKGEGTNRSFSPSFTAVSIALGISASVNVTSSPSAGSSVTKVFTRMEPT